MKTSQGEKDRLALRRGVVIIASVITALIGVGLVVLTRGFWLVKTICFKNLLLDIFNLCSIQTIASNAEKGGYKACCRAYA
jgi:hypothetical protein